VSKVNYLLLLKKYIKNGKFKIFCVQFASLETENKEPMIYIFLGNKHLAAKFENFI